ncbi:hypothetical protein FF098_012115 [Parvularcula flava]|uniref:Uncharacterized protein n=1 Tax=Aquisalinus luteolus TaxID=1566827 RepID=A0A8J3ERX2_9PROT|nr:hypothetical protein [Aquisalinus luteolus]NHK28655.1 hypothetical protein [Aquisalinus luteolus]GGH99125.1 hypothetical protein GCM10011355_24340 [Aquisalinus luteolus]
MTDLSLFIIAIIIGFCIAAAGRIAQGTRRTREKGSRYSLWLNAVGGSILIFLLTGLVWIMLEPKVEAQIAQCEAMMGYDCEDANLALVAVLLIGTGALILNLVFSLVFKLIRQRGSAS